MQVTFDMTALGNPALTSSDVYVTFAAAASDMVYGSGTTAENIDFAGGSITIDKQSYGTSRAYSLHDIHQNGLVLNSATSLVGFISYGTAAGIEKLAVGTQPNLLSAATPRYSVFEISCDGTSGGADVTNISQYGGSIQLAFLDAKQNVQAYVGNTLGTTGMFQALAATSGFSGTASTTAVLLDGSGKFLRVIGTNLFPNGSVQNPYPTYNAYLQSLFTTYGTKSVVKELTNLAPGQKSGGAGSVGYPSTKGAKNVSANTIYNLDYHFTATVSQATPPAPGNPSGTYSVQLDGHVCATLAGSDKGKTQSYEYDGLSISIAADDLVGGNLYMTNFIYQAATSGAGIEVASSGWDDLNSDFGSANVNAALLLKAAGDFAEGMTCGFPGSQTASTSNPGLQLSELTSYEWWQNPLLAYGPAQPKNAYYSAYGNVVSANSAGINGSSFSRGGVYGSPYDDRFGLNLISPNANTAEMKITLLADGDLTPAAS